MPSGRRWSSGRATACPANPRAWLVSTGRFKAIDGMRRRARFDALDEVGAAAEIAVVDAAAWADDGEHRRRPVAPDLHLLPPGVGARRAGRPHAARGVRL